jgi:hypothetical protein
MEWSFRRTLSNLEDESCDTLGKFLLDLKPPFGVQIISLWSPYGGVNHWLRDNKIAAIKLVRAAKDPDQEGGALFGLLESKLFCEMSGVLRVTESEYHRICGIFGQKKVWIDKTRKLL